MFTKSTIALAILLGMTASAFAVTKKPNPTPPGGGYINNAPQGWHNPNFSATWDPNGVRWDCSC